MKQEGAKTRRIEDCSGAVIAACIEVHRQLGPGVLESAYEQCLCHEPQLRGIAHQRQVPLPRVYSPFLSIPPCLFPLVYKGLPVKCGYRLDLVVENELVLELKAVEQLMPVHAAQVITYLRLGGYPTGLLVNFHVAVLRSSLKRFVNSK